MTANIFVVCYGFVEVTDIVKAGHAGHCADIQRTFPKEAGAHADTVGVGIFQDGHSGHGFKESAEMPFADIEFFRQLRKSDHRTGSY